MISKKLSLGWIVIITLHTFLFGLLTNTSGAAIKSHPKQEGAFREARIILPTKTNTGDPLDLIKSQLEQMLVDTFNGFTQFVGMGGWESGSDTYGKVAKILHHESVWIYDIACIDNSNTTNKLTEIATWLKKEANQESVYLRLPNGEVTFVM